jgi:hypothetical protein
LSATARALVGDCASIVATETSTITFISVPGIAFAKGGNFHFCSLFSLYARAHRDFAAVYSDVFSRRTDDGLSSFWAKRFGLKVKMLASALFVVMRNIADGIRLLLTAIVLSAVYVAFQPNADVNSVIVASIILLGAIMIILLITAEWKR